MPALLEVITEERSGIRNRKVTRFGLGAIDGLLGGGVKPGELLILAARPSMGKTALALQASIHAAISGQSMVFSLEMDAESILRRAVSNVSGVPFDTIEQSRLTDDMYRRVTRGTQDLAKINLLLDDSAGITSEQIAVRVQRQQGFGEVSMVMVDYLEMVGDSGEHEERRLTKITHRLKRLALEAHVPVILLSQLSRKVEERTIPIPRLSDLRWSGSLEAIADKIAFIYREDYYLDKGMLEHGKAENPGANITQFRLDKNRNGKTGIARVTFDGPIFRFNARSDAESFGPTQESIPV
jgi:replicative DNA helicase